MSFQENDFPHLIEILNQFQKKNRNNPALIEKVVIELVKNYHIIPLYPGLVSATLMKMVRKEDPRLVRAGNWVTFQHKKKIYSGYVKSTDAKSMTLEHGAEITPLKRKKLKKAGLKGMLHVFEDQLKQDWPMFFFKDNK
ncbi:MAG: hypothetical protein PHF84_04170 [bacterium]|nr:hypothetical protein [bacterium]